MKTVILFLLGLLLFISCNTSDHQAELEQIDSLYQTIQDIQVSLKNYDGELLKKNEQIAKSQLNFIANNWPKTDSMPRATAAFLSDYKVNKKSLGFYAKQLNRLEEECAYSTKQLEGLRNDVSNNIHTSEELKTYLQDEIEATQVLVEGNQTLDAKYTKIIQRHNGLKPRVDSVVTSMNKRGIR